MLRLLAHALLARLVMKSHSPITRCTQNWPMISRNVTRRSDTIIKDTLDRHVLIRGRAGTITPSL
jgi:hypothetical protein